MHITAMVFLAIVIIMVVARLFGRFAVRIGQPPVVGEIVAGIALGPSLLGLLPGDLDEKLFPPEVLPYLTLLANLGLVLFMFIVGLELDMLLIRGREKLAGTISVASVVLPFALGAGVAVLLYPSHDTTDSGPVSQLALTLFLGVAMSITAFPVLARILTDRGMHRTSIGVIALAAAAVDDVIAWTLLAFVVAVVQGNGPVDVLRIVLLTAVFAAVMFGLVRPALRRLTSWYERAGRLTPDILAIVLIGVLLSSVITEVIGIHAIFGAFIFGAIMPRKGAVDLTREILERLEQVSVLLLLPLFFVVTGLSTDIGGITGDSLWQLGLILLAAVGGKFLGAFGGARAMRLPTRQSAAIAILMNTRGLTELVILVVGRQLGVLDDQLFTMLVLMALITTAMTGPLLKLVYSDRVLARDIAAAERAAMGQVDSYRVLALVDDQDRAARLAALGAVLLGTRQPAEVVLSRLVGRPKAPLEVGAALVPDLSRMATTADELNALARTVAARGVQASVIARFTSDPWQDLVGQAEAVEADVVLVDEQWFTSHRADFEAAAVPFTTAVARLDDRDIAAGDPVAVIADGSADGRAAVLLGAAAAGQLRGPLVLGGDGGRIGRRLASALGPLRGSGLDVRRADDAGVPPARLSLLAAGSGGVGSGTVVRVHAGRNDRDSELSEEIAKLVPAQ